MIYSTLMNTLKEKTEIAQVLIIGSGVVGKFNALKLSQNDYSVILTDPSPINNSSNAALGILMGKIYRKRRGRSWELRRESMNLWPKWIKTLKKYNKKIELQRPLFKLTTDDRQFQKMVDFVSRNPNENLEIVEKNSHDLKNIKQLFSEPNIRGIVSHDDGRVNPQILLEALDDYLQEQKNVSIQNEHIVSIKKINKNWIARSKTGKEITSNVIILCNSLNSIKLLTKEKYGLELKPVLGQAIEIEKTNDYIDFLKLPNVLSINKINIIPINKKKIIIGSTDEFDIHPNTRNLEELFEFLNKKPTWLTSSNVTRKWYGIRSKPYGEPAPIMRTLEDGLIICSGFYKNGILLAPACANWLSKEIKKHISK